MAIAFRNSTTLVESSAGSTLRTITKPTGLADGDYVIIIVHDNLTGNPTATTTPSGFTQQRRQIDGGLTTEVYVKLVTDVGSEGDWQIQYGTSSVKLNIHCLAYSGCHQTTPLLTDGIAAETTTTDAHVTPTVNVTESGCWVVSNAADRTSAAGTTWTGADTERHDTQNSGSNPISTMTQDSNGTVGTGNTSRTLTATASNGVATMWIGVLQPPAGGTNHTQTPTDQANPTDTRSVGYGKFPADTEGLTDTSSVVLLTVVQASDGAGLTDTSTVEKSGTGTLDRTDAMGLTDPFASQAELIRSPTDTLGLTDTNVRTISKSVTTADSSGLGDTFTKASIILRSFTDQSPLTDPRTVNPGLGVAVADTTDIGSSVVLTMNGAPIDPTSASLVLSTVWLNLASDLTDYVSFPTMSSMSFVKAAQPEVRRLAGGRYRLLRRAGDARSFALSLPACDRDQIGWLEEHVGDVVCVRDDRGRKVYGVYLAVQVDESRIETGSANVTVNVTEVFHQEALIVGGG